MVFLSYVLIGVPDLFWYLLACPPQDAQAPSSSLSFVLYVLRPFLLLLIYISAPALRKGEQLHRDAKKRETGKR